MALPKSMDPELRRQIEAVADRSETTVDEWIERAVRRELERQGRGESLADYGIVRAAPGAKPKPLRNPPRLLDGSKMSDAIIEDRR